MALRRRLTAGLPLSRTLRLQNVGLFRRGRAYTRSRASFTRTLHCQTLGRNKGSVKSLTGKFPESAGSTGSVMGKYAAGKNAAAGDRALLWCAQSPAA